jgi:hypothetical protein
MSLLGGECLIGPKATRQKVTLWWSPALRRLTFWMAAPARFAGRPGGDVLATEVAAVLTLGGLTAATFVRAVLHPRYLLTILKHSLAEGEERTRGPELADGIESANAGEWLNAGGNRSGTEPVTSGNGERVQTQRSSARACSQAARSTTRSWPLGEGRTHRMASGPPQLETGSSPCSMRR